MLSPHHHTVPQRCPRRHARARSHVASNALRLVVLTMVASLTAVSALVDRAVAESSSPPERRQSADNSGSGVSEGSGLDADAGAHRAQAQALLQQAGRVVEEIDVVRGVGALREIPSEVQDRTVLGHRIRELILREYPVEEIEADQRAMVVAGILQPGDNLFDMTLGMLQENIAGYYDHETGIFFILDDTPPDAQEMVMSHELFHAIQDQVWGVERVRGPEDSLTDVTLARTAVLEGDAVAVDALARC